MFDFESYVGVDWIKLILSLFVFGYFVVLYNRLVSLKQDVFEGFSNIEIILKQRHEEIPKLVATIRAYVKYEKGLFDDILDARKAVISHADNPENVVKLGHAESKLRGLLFALAEDTPEIKSNFNFLQFQRRMSALHSEISDRREYYNSCVNNNNTVRLQFPDVIVALLLGFKSYELLKFDEAELADHDLTKLFGK